MSTHRAKLPQEHARSDPLTLNIFDRLESFFSALYPPLVAASTAITIIALVCFMFFMPNFAVFSILSLCGSGMLALAYKALLPSLHQPKPLDRTRPDMILSPPSSITRTDGAGPTIAILINQTMSTDQTQHPDESGRRRLLRYGVAAGSLALAVLTIALILSKYGLVEDFLLIFPFTAFFPFSYLAYAVFQREVRIKRLRNDFGLLGLEFPDEIVQQIQGFGYFALHITLAMLFTIVGLSLFGDLTTYDTVLGPITIAYAARTAMQYGFLGSYLFAVQLIYRRYTTYDLHPTVYMYSALTILSGLIFNYVAFKAISYVAETNHQLGSPFEAILAFGLGFFPLLAVQWFYNIVSKAFSTQTKRSDDLPLGLLDGVSTMHEIRLRDFGIDNIQNLAAVDLSLLLINTPFTAQLVVDWVDQAILYLYLEQNEIVSFRQAQVRTVSDFREIWKPMYDRTLPESLVKSPRNGHEATVDDLRQETAGRLIPNTSPEYLDLLYESTNYGPNLHFVVHYWKNADRQRKIDYLCRIFPEYNAPKYGYALGQAFREFGYHKLSNAMEKDAEKIWCDLNEIWTEIEKFPIDIEQTITLNSGLAWAGLAFLNHRFAPHDNLDVRKAFMVKSIQYYQQALKSNQALTEQIENHMNTIADDELHHAEQIIESFLGAIHQIDALNHQPAKKIGLEDVCNQLCSLQEYLPEMMQQFNGFSTRKNSKSIQELQRLAKVINDLPIGTEQPDWEAIASKIEGNGSWHIETEEKAQSVGD